jgi:hypothetical protein
MLRVLGLESPFFLYFCSTRHWVGGRPPFGGQPATCLEDGVGESHRDVGLEGPNSGA